MIEIKNLTKKYKHNAVNSVENVCLSINSGEIFGFLGRNGAGKSTTIKCISGIIPFDSGSISVCGYDIVAEPIKAKECLGYVSDEHGVYEILTGKEYVNFIGNIYNIEPELITSRFNYYCKRFNMENHIDRPIRNYSFGLKQKINIIAVLIHEPKVFVLDEPIIGLDPESAYEIKQCILEQKQKGNTVFFSSHNVDMVEKLCDKVAIINKGIILEIIDMKEFLAKQTVSLERYYLDLINKADLQNQKDEIDTDVSKDNNTNKDDGKVKKNKNKENKIHKENSKNKVKN